MPEPVPESTSEAFDGGGLGLSSYDDFYGNPRGETPSQGAIET